MKKTNIFLTIATLLLLACGGGGGGGDAADGGFQQEKAPEISVRVRPQVLLPNVTGGRYEALRQADPKAIGTVDVTVTRGNLPLETGTGDKAEVYVSVLNTGVDAALYCFDAGNDNCKETVKNALGEEVEVLKPLGGMNVNLNNGMGSFAVTSLSGETGYVDLRISAAASASSVSVKTIRIPVKYPSSGGAFQLSLRAPDVINPNVANQFSVIIMDEAGNPVSDSDKNNLIVTASDLNGVTLGAKGQTGSSIYTKTENGVAVISLLAKQTGFVKITAQADGKDNNMENDIQQLLETSKIIQVTNDRIIVLGPINITVSSLPNGAEGVNYRFEVPTTGSPLASMVVLSGNVPPGLTLDSAGLLSGKPTVAGQYSFVVKATGVDGSEAVKMLTMIVAKGGLKLEPTKFEKITIPADFPCLAVAQTVTVKSDNSDYTAKPPFTWHYDVGDIPTALKQGVATPLRDANGKLLTGLELTVTDDTRQVTMNGEACRGRNLTGGYGIIFGVTDANGIAVESVIPLVIGEEKEAILELPEATVRQRYNASIQDAVRLLGNVPVGLRLANGLLTGVPAPGSQGEYLFRAVLSNGSQQTVKLVVKEGEPVPAAPDLTLAQATVGVDYNASIPRAVRRTGGNVPPGLNFSDTPPTQGMLSGKPTTVGTYSFRVQLDDGRVQQVSIEVVAGDIDDSNTLELEAATVGTPYHAAVPGAVEMTGALPDGLIAKGNVISGVAKNDTQATYRLEAKLSTGVTRMVTLVVKPLPDLNLTAEVGAPYNHTVPDAVGISGNPPEGLMISDTSPVISGEPAEGSAGSYQLIATLNASRGDVTQKINLTVTQPGDGDGSGPGGAHAWRYATVGKPYRLILNALSIVGPYPAGLNLVGGNLTGKPAEGTEGRYTFTAVLAGNLEKVYTLVVKAKPESLSEAKVGVPYEVAFPNAQSVKGSNIPLGLTLAGNKLSGTPEPGSEGDYIFTVTRNDGILQDYTLKIKP